MPDFPQVLFIFCIHYFYMTHFSAIRYCKMPIKMWLHAGAYSKSMTYCVETKRHKSDLDPLTKAAIQDILCIINFVTSKTWHFNLHERGHSLQFPPYNYCVTQELFNTTYFIQIYLNTVLSCVDLCLCMICSCISNFGFCVWQ